MIDGIELGKFATDGTELVVIKEEATNAFFAVEASYLEQDAGPVVSPYGNGCVSLTGGDRELHVVTGRLWGEDDDTACCVEVAPGEDPADVFRNRLLIGSGIDPQSVPDEPEDGEEQVIIVSSVSLGDFLANKIG